APDVILATGGSVVPSLLQASRTVPIIFTQTTDPVGADFVNSLARPGGNVTGMSSQSNDSAAKRLELLRELIPGLRRFAIMANSDAPAAMLEVADAEATARGLGLEVVVSKIKRAEDITPAFAALKSHADALLVPPEPLVFINRIRINILAAAAHLPTIYGLRAYVEAGRL